MKVRQFLALSVSIPLANSFPTNPSLWAIPNRHHGPDKSHNSSEINPHLRSNSLLRTFARSGAVVPINTLRGGATAAGGGPAAAAASTATSLKSVPAWVEVCGLAAPFASVFVSLSPFPTVRKILKEKTVGDLPLLPYSSLVANCFIWTMYGFLRKEAKLWSCNGFSTLLGIYYFASFAKYSPKSSPTLPGSVAQHFQACVGGIFAACAIAVSLPRTKAASLMGRAGVAICIALFASPLAALKTVIKNRSAESIPLPFALAATLNCFLWFVVGTLDMNDINIWLPNSLGLICGLVQIALKLWFGDGNKDLELAESKQAA